MNIDNRRLKEIQEFKQVYYKELDKTETLTDCNIIQEYINRLEEEEREILERGGVKI